jgi:hypothetical protein
MGYVIVSVMNVFVFLCLFSRKRLKAILFDSGLVSGRERLWGVYLEVALYKYTFTMVHLLLPIYWINVQMVLVSFF